MDVLGLISVPNWIIFLFIFLLFIYIYACWNYGYWENQNVKAVPSFPLFGSLPSMLTRTAAEFDLENSKKLGKVFGYYEFRSPCLMIHDVEMLKAVLIKDFQYFTDRRYVPLGGKANTLLRKFLINLQGDEWRAARAVLTPTFTTSKLKHMGVLMTERARKMTECVRQDIEKQDGIINLKDRIGVFSMDIISSCCFGHSLESQDLNDPFIQHANLLFKQNFVLLMFLIIICPKLIDILNLPIFPTKCITYFENAIKKVVNFRREQKERRNDFLQLLLDAQEQETEGKILEGDDDTFSAEEKVEVNASTLKKTKVLDENGLVSNAVLFIVAGFDTATNAICFALYLLALNPDIQTKLREEIDETLTKHGKLSYEIIMTLPYMEMVFCETLRMYPPALRLERTCTRDYDLQGITIKKGMMVSAGVYAIHYDPETYPEPNKFDPERFTPENKAQRHSMAYMPFGAGPRTCIGVRFAQMEVKIALAYFIKDFIVSPCAQTEIPLKFLKGLPSLNPLHGITLKVEPRL